MEYQPGPDTESLVAAILSTQFPRMPAHGIYFAGKGAVNLAYGAYLGDRKVIVRLTDGRHRPMEHTVEAWCLQRAAAAGVPGPQSLAVGSTGDTAWMVQEFVEGVRGDDSSVEDPAGVWRTLGEYARIIHKIDVSDFPERKDPDPDWAEKEWARFVAYDLASLTPDDQLIALGVYRAEQQPEIRAIFERIQARPARFGLNHGDISVYNAMVSPNGCISLLDWGCAGVDILPYREISAVLRWLAPDDPRFMAFLEGFGLSAAEFDAFLPELVDYELLKSFDLVRWSLDRYPVAIDDYVAEAKSKMAQSGLG